MSTEVSAVQRAAVVYLRPRALELVQAAAVEPGVGEVEIAPAYTGICGTDLHIFNGHMDRRVTLPMTIGHEMSARISRVGPGVDGWQVGQPVTVMPLRWDGTCASCRAGNTHLCHSLDFIGIDSPGSLQSRLVVPAGVLVALPDRLSLEVGALVEPTAVAVHDVRRAEVSAGERVLVVGGGPIGLLIACVARRAGAEVRIAEPDAYRRGVADTLGFGTYDPTEVGVVPAVEQWTGGAGADVAFEVSGAPAGLEVAVACLRTRGRVCLVAIHSQPRPVDLHRFFWRELNLIGARLYERSDFEEAVRLVADGVVPAESLITRIVPMDEALGAFELLESGGSVMKVLVDCQSADVGAVE